MNGKQLVTAVVIQTTADGQLNMASPKDPEERLEVCQLDILIKFAFTFFEVALKWFTIWRQELLYMWNAVGCGRALAVPFRAWHIPMGGLVGLGARRRK
jgi:hypothetical protein